MRKDSKCEYRPRPKAEGAMVKVELWCGVITEYDILIHIRIYAYTYLITEYAILIHAWIDVLITEFDILIHRMGYSLHAMETYSAVRLFGWCTGLYAIARPPRTRRRRATL